MHVELDELDITVIRAALIEYQRARRAAAAMNTDSNMSKKYAKVLESVELVRQKVDTEWR